MTQSKAKSDSKHSRVDARAKKKSKGKKKTQAKGGIGHFLWCLLLSSISGVMVFTSFPTYDIFPLQWFSLIPLLFVIEGKRPFRAALWGLWAGTVTNVGGFYWITGMLMDFGHFSLAMSIPICLLLCTYQGAVFAIWAALTRWMVVAAKVNVLWVSAVVWVVVESIVPLIFPWYFGNGQYLFTAVIQICEITGVVGVSFVLVLVNTGLYLGLRDVIAGRWRRAYRPVLMVIVVFAINTLYGVVRIGQVEAIEEAAPKLRIGMVEANVGIFEKEARQTKSAYERINMLRGNILKHHLLTNELQKKENVDLVVEPESSFIPVHWRIGTVSFKRNDLFAVVGGIGRNVWERRDDTWQGPKRVGRDDTVIHGIHSGHEKDLLAVGDNGTILTEVGGEWTQSASGTSAHLYGVWSATQNKHMFRLDGAPMTAWAVGANGTALHRGTSGRWRVVPTGTNVTLRGVSGRDAKTVYAVGDRGTILRWNGKKWRAMKSPVTTRLRAVWSGPGGGEIIVGDNGVVLTLRDSKWRKTTVGSAHLRGVTGDAGYWVAVGDKGTILSYNGSSWKSEDSATQRNLHAVSGDGRGDLYAVGDRGVLLVKKRDSGVWAAPVPLRKSGNLRAVAGVPFSEGHAYAQETRFIHVGKAPLPKPVGGNVIDAVKNIGPTLKTDRANVADWNTPMRDSNVPILLGLLTYEVSEPGVVPALKRENRRPYNSAMLIDGEGRVLGRYDKTYLLVFGEYIPFGDVFPQFYDWLPEASHFYPGRSVETFAFKGHQLGVMICYEDILPGFARKLAGKDPNVLINVTNDAWFGKTSEPYLHLALAVFRTVENRLWLVRSTNTGVSAYVDAVGRIVEGSDLDNPEIMAQDVPMLRTNTLYRTYGEIFAYLCFLVFGTVTVATLLRRKRKIKA